LLKIVLGIPWYLPHSIGGTEVYVSALASELQKIDIECLVAVPSVHGRAAESIYRGVRVVHYQCPVRTAPAESILASVNADAFQALLASEQPDVYHQHDWTLNCGLSHLRAAKQLGIPTIITLHLAKLICRMNTMLYEGISQCDGKVIESRCARCYLTTRGMPRLLAGPISKIPTDVSTNLMNLPFVGRVFSGRVTASNFAVGLHSVIEIVDRIVTGSEWLKEALLINGIQPSKLETIRSGVDPEVIALSSQTPSKSGGMLRIGFLGRWNQAKGLHVLVEALKRVPDAPYTLHVLATGEDSISVAYRQKIEKMIGQRSQFQLRTNQPRSAVNRFFQEIDLLAVPSQCVETGPLVALEANAWKVPVVGSDLGGIRELIRHQVDGILVPHGDVEAWTNALARLARDPIVLAQLRKNIRPVRTMRDTARDMSALYRAVFADRSPSP
jgi:glycosyltransferase involved in cell wall biosynthesis